MNTKLPIDLEDHAEFILAIAERHGVTLTHRGDQAARPADFKWAPGDDKGQNSKIHAVIGELLRDRGISDAGKSVGTFEIYPLTDGRWFIVSWLDDGGATLLIGHPGDAF